MGLLLQNWTDAAEGATQMLKRCVAHDEYADRYESTGTQMPTAIHVVDVVTSEIHNTQKQY